MPPLLAEASASVPPAAELAAFLGCAAFLLGLVVLLRKVFGHEPPLHHEYLSRVEHDRFRDETLAELKRHAARRAEIYDEQRAQGERISALATASDRQTADLAALQRSLEETNARIDAVPMRTIQLLRDTQQLHQHNK